MGDFRGRGGVLVHCGNSGGIYACRGEIKRRSFTDIFMNHLKLKSIVFMIFLFACCSCRNATTDKTREGDSVMAKTAASRVNGVRAASRDTGMEGADGNVTDVYNDYVSEYEKRHTIDTGFAVGADSFRLQLTHYCLHDSAIKVPREYVYMYGLDSFVTHNFATTVRLDRNNRTILQRIVHKEDFDALLDKGLKKYSALLYPEMGVVKDSVYLYYSISVPLTDVGIGVHMVVDRAGGITYCSN